ncbi:MAG: DUF6503 family protein [Cyclobacteriaceae bacterium]
MKYLITSIIIISLATGCQPNQPAENAGAEEVTPAPTEHHSENLAKIFEAHGGFQKWASMKQLSYTKGGESTITNLSNRKIRLVSEKQTIGFDGENVWITPDSVDAGRARFYHNLYFYFYAMPFVVGDPGAFYKDVDPRKIKGEPLNGIKVSYGESVGDSPEDFYIIWYDPETYKMKWLMYTVTFRSGEANENYRLIKYDQWAEFEGLLLPTTIQWHEYKDGIEGEMSNEVVFENIALSTEAPSEDLFEMPEGAQIAPPPPGKTE